MSGDSSRAADVEVRDGRSREDDKAHDQHDVDEEPDEPLPYHATPPWATTEAADVDSTSWQEVEKRVTVKVQAWTKGSISGVFAISDPRGKGYHD
jgi:hypothetical protein